jgi:thiamine-phosphate pyrophosphorylase
MIDPQRLRGLYAITDTAIAVRRGQTLPDMVTAALRGGAKIIQYRDKASTPALRHATALQLRKLCEQFNAMLLINDDVALALACDAHGVHLGQSDAALPAARAQLGPDKIIGVSCHGDLTLALRAQQHGADYIALGRFFPSQTKPHAPPATLATLIAIRNALQLPIVAIGGVTPKNAPELIAAGADMIAAIAGTFDTDDIELAARQYVCLFASLTPGVTMK